MYGKKERSGGGKSVAEGKGCSRRFGAASPAGPGAAEQETYGATGATTLRDAPSRVVSTGFGMIPRFVGLGEKWLGSFVSDLDTMPWLLGREVSSCCVSGHG